MIAHPRQLPTRTGPSQNDPRTAVSGVDSGFQKQYVEVIRLAEESQHAVNELISVISEADAHLHDWVHSLVALIAQIALEEGDDLRKRIVERGGVCFDRSAKNAELFEGGTVFRHRGTIGVMPRIFVC